MVTEEYCMECGEPFEDDECPVHGKYVSAMIYCPYCGEKYDDDDYHIVYESRGEFWGAPCSEPVLYWVDCHNCGERYDV